MLASMKIPPIFPPGYFERTANQGSKQAKQLMKTSNYFFHFNFSLHTTSMLAEEVVRGCLLQQLCLGVFFVDFLVFLSIFVGLCSQTFEKSSKYFFASLKKIRDVICTIWFYKSSINNLQMFFIVLGNP